MKQLTSLLALGVIVAVIALAGLQALTETLPGVEAARVREAQAAAQLAEERARIDAQEYPPRQGAITAAVILAVMGVGVGAAIGLAGLGVALARGANLRAETISAQPSTGLYPVRYAPGNMVHLVNEPGAQRLAALGARQRVSAPQLGRLLESPGAQAAIEPPAVEVDDLPERVNLDIWRPSRHLELPLGVGHQGRVLTIPIDGADTALMLVSGLPGSGKSALLHSFVSAVARQSPDGRRCSLAVIDGKMCEFSNLAGGFMWDGRPVASMPDDITRLVGDVRGELTRRLQLMAAAGVRDYRTLQIPLLLLLIDELAIISHDGAVMGRLTDIARLGRAAGVMTIASTQRVSAHTLRPEYRAVADHVVSFRQRAANESKIALGGDCGAELIPAIPGRGIHRRGELEPFQAFWAEPQPVEPVWIPQIAPNSVPEPVEPVAPGDDLPRLRAGEPIPDNLVGVIRQRHQGGESLNRLSFGLYGHKSGQTLAAIRQAIGGES